MLGIGAYGRLDGLFGIHRHRSCCERALAISSHRRHNSGAASAADLTCPVGHVPTPRRDPLCDEVAFNNWPYVAATHVPAIAVNRKGRRDRNQHRRGGGAEKQFVHDTLRSPPDQSIRWRWWTHWPGPPFGTGEMIFGAVGRTPGGFGANQRSIGNSGVRQTAVNGPPRQSALSLRSAPYSRSERASL